MLDRTPLQTRHSGNRKATELRAVIQIGKNSNGWCRPAMARIYEDMDGSHFFDLAVMDRLCAEWDLLRSSRRERP